MQNSDIPNKFLLAWAQNDTSRVEVPVTTTDATRASQSLGFPPLTMQPPEAGGVPPNGEDFNGGLNQISRVVRWLMAGNSFPYDSTFASAPQIGGYATGAVLPFLGGGTGMWISTADNNANDPSVANTTWVPAWAYGGYTQAVTSPATVMLPERAARPIITLTGTLTANTTVTIPAWVREWTIRDNTVRAGFTLTLQTPSGSGVVLASGVQRVRGDGTNIVQVPESIAAATATTQAATLGQTLGQQRAFTSSGSFPIPAGVTTVYISAGAGGGGGGAGGGSVSGTNIGSGGAGGGAGQSVQRTAYTVSGSSLSITVGAAGSAGVAVSGANGGAGGNGGNTIVSGLSAGTLTLTGGAGGGGGISTATTQVGGPAGGAGYPRGASGSDASQNNASANGGMGASCPFGGGGGNGRGGTAAGAPGPANNGADAFGYSAGGGGGGGYYTGATTQPGGSGGAGAPGWVLIEW